MKPKITFLLIASVISLLVVFSGCKKDIDKNTLANKEASIQVANTFLTMLEVKANNHKDAKIKLLKLSLKTDNLTTFIDSNKNMFVCINSSTEVVKKSSDRYLVLKINSSGEPLWGILISYSGSTDEKNMAKVFSNFLKGSDVRDGTYTAYDYDGSFYFENEYQKNRITKIKTVGKNNLLGRSQDACIDWYLVTTYYYADGTTERTTEYVTSTCYGECPPELMCYTEAMGANSSNPPPTVTTQVDWVVGSSPSWYVKS